MEDSVDLPNVNGYICSRRIRPIPTIGVIVAVVMDDDWTAIVIPQPSKIARYPLMLVALWMNRVDPPNNIPCCKTTSNVRPTKMMKIPKMNDMIPAIVSDEPDRRLDETCTRFVVRGCNVLGDSFRQVIQVPGNNLHRQ